MTYLDASLPPGRAWTGYRRTSWVLVGLLASGCSTSGDAGEAYYDSGASTSAGQSSGEPATTSRASSSSTGDGDGDDTAGTTAGTDSATGTPSLDAGAPESACDVWIQDCPAGDKCSWEQTDLGAQPICVPVDPAAKPPGEPCEVWGDPGSGHDDCALGSVCAWVDETNHGRCLALCQGGPEQPSCDDVQPQAICQPCVDCPSLCVPVCNPLADECGPGYACKPNAGTFTCTPTNTLGEGGLGDACEYSVQCQANYACIEGALVPGCEGAGCCSPFCSIDDPSCPAELDCAPWSGAGDEPMPDVGVCALPD